MTDREKANDLAQYYSEESDYKRTVGYDCAIAMADWKDEQHTEEKQQWIEKSCEWLEKHVEDFMPPTNSLHDYNTGELIHFFKKAMEE